MNRKFEKVERVKNIDFNLPVRKTKKSAGYDFECIETITIPPYKLGDKPVLVPTVVIYVLWYSFGMGKKRIARFKDELDKHLDILEDDKKYELTLQDMTKMLREEADIDLQFIDDGKKIDRRGK